MRKAQKPASVPQDPSNPQEDDDCRLSASDWERCIKDDCASWELPCLVYINQRSHDNIFPKPTLIRVEYFGKKASFDRQSWTGMVETIEYEFAESGYGCKIASSNKSDSVRAWKQWVIVPKRTSPAGRSSR